MILYHYNRTGEYTGKSDAVTDPVEHRWLIPARAVTVPPPDAIPGFARMWNGSAWNQTVDYRGRTYYTADGAEQTVTKPGELPAGCVWTRPESPPEVREYTRLQIADAIIALGKTSAAIALLEQYPVIRFRWEAAAAIREDDPNLTQMLSILQVTQNELKTQITGE